VIRGIVVFALTYLLVAGRRLRALPIDRPAGALVGAVLAVATGAVTPAAALGAIDGRTIALLFAVMGMGAYLSMDGFFERAAPVLGARLRTRGALLAALVWSAGLLSALITNDAVCVLAAPVVVSWIERWKLPRLPFLLALATASNTGSVATLIGNPQNMLCASLGDLSFRGYAAHMVPVAIAALAVNHAVLWLVFRRELGGPLEESPRAAPERLFTWRAGLALAILAATVGFYVAGTDLVFTSLAGLVLMMLVFRVSQEKLWERVDWSVLVFFSGLFVAVEAFRASGAPAWVFARVPLVGSETGLAADLRTSAYFLAGSNVVTNVPFIVIVKDEIAKMPDPRHGWELLAMASTFAGNLTLLGSVANVIVAERSRRVGGLGFWEYLRVGFPVAVLTTLAGAAWLHVIR
jgi:Na+/H+ antiporter NhaD/arsenite permease-like protein